MVFLLNESLLFPEPALADEDGLLAVGGDLSPTRLMLAYEQGIFPWYSDGEPILWYSPHRRFVILPQDVYISHSMKQLIRSHRYTVTWDKAFEQVISHCSEIRRPGQAGTWITKEMKGAYIALHKLGAVHSVEVWENDVLVGGLYGVESGAVFCGESMFSLAPNASKLALIWLCTNKGYDLIDCQMHTPHLESMGGIYMNRDVYMNFLES